MNRPVILSGRARKHLQALRRYLADRFSERNAESYVNRVFSACEAIGKAPYRGSQHPEIGPNVRSVGFERRVFILFEIEPERIVILAIHYGGRIAE